MSNESRAKLAASLGLRYMPALAAISIDPNDGVPDFTIPETWTISAPTIEKPSKPDDDNIVGDRHDR